MYRGALASLDLGGNPDTRAEQCSGGTQEVLQSAEEQCEAARENRLLWICCLLREKKMHQYRYEIDFSSGCVESPFILSWWLQDVGQLPLWSLTTSRICLSNPALQPQAVELSQTEGVLK